MSNFAIFIAILFSSLMTFAQREVKLPEMELSPVIFRADNFDQVYLGLFDNYSGVSRAQAVLNDTSKLLTSIDYEIGSNRFQRFDLSHKQRLSNRSGFNIQFNRKTFDGRIDHSVFENSSFQGDYDWEVDTGLVFHFRISHSNHSRELNWGMSDDTLMKNPRLNRSLVPVLNETAVYSGKRYRIEGDALYGKTLKLGVGFDIQRRDYLYFDDPSNLPALYDTVYFDSTLTNDLMKEGYEQVYVQLKTDGNLDVIFKTGVLSKYYENFGLTRNNRPFSSIELSQGDHVEFGFTSVYGDGILVNSHLIMNFYLNQKWPLDINMSMAHGNNSIFYTNYNSNHYQWDKAGVQNTRVDANMSLKDSLQRIGLRIGVNAENNAMAWVDSTDEFVPLQSLQSICHSELWGKYIPNSKWEFAITYGLNPVLTGNYYKYPVHTIKANISKKGVLFKGKLKYKLELLPEYYSRFDQYLFNPILFTVYPGDQKNEIPGYLYTNLKLTAWLGDVELFLKIWHINQGLTDYNYFDFTNYWGKDRFVSFGLKKVFNN